MKTSLSKCVIGAALLAVHTLGCGDGAAPLVSVSGRLFLDEKPLPGKTLRFVPEMGTPGQGAGATTNAEGSYKLLAVRPGATKDVYGVPPGKYRVVVTEPMFPLDLKLPDDSMAEGDIPAGAIGLPTARPRKSPIPAKYTNADTTPLKIEVTGAGDIHLKLTSGG